MRKLVMALTMGAAFFATAAHLYPQPAGEVRNAAGYAVTIDGQSAGVAAVRNSAMPVNIRWPGHQREIDQTEIDGMVRFSTAGKAVIAVTAFWEGILAFGCSVLAISVMRGGASACALAYTFFNQEGFITSSHMGRILRDVWDRTAHNRVDRWVMVTVYAMPPRGGFIALSPVSALEKFLLRFEEAFK